MRLREQPPRGRSDREPGRGEEITMSTKLLRVLCFAAAVLVAVAGANADIMPFANSTDYTNNWTATTAGTAYNSGTGQGGAAGYLQMGTSAGVWSNIKYTPALEDAFTMSLDAKFAGTGQVLGVFFGNGTNNGHYFIMGQEFNDQTPDVVKLATNRPIDGFGGSPVQVGNTAITTWGTSTSTWYHLVVNVARTSPTTLSATYSVFDPSNLVTPLFTATQTGISDIFTSGSQIGIGVSGNSLSAGVAIDNIGISSTPEPATMAMLAIGGVGVLLRRRRTA